MNGTAGGRESNFVARERERIYCSVGAISLADGLQPRCLETSNGAADRLRFCYWRIDPKRRLLAEFGCLFVLFCFGALWGLRSRSLQRVGALRGGCAWACLAVPPARHCARQSVRGCRPALRRVVGPAGAAPSLGGTGPVFRPETPMQL